MEREQGRETGAVATEAGRDDPGGEAEDGGEGCGGGEFGEAGYIG